MSVTDEVLIANQSYVSNFNLGHLAMPPARKLAIVARMDARLTVEQFLGLKTGARSSSPITCWAPRRSSLSTTRIAAC